MRSSGASVIIAAVAAMSSFAQADTTVHIDLPSNPLGFFGLAFSFDHASEVADIQGGVITSTRFHLEFDTTVSPNPFQNAANLAIDFQPPAGDLPIFTLTGAMLGWNGTGQFTGDFETSALNLPILDFPPEAGLALWFVRILSLDENNQLLGGQLTNSSIEVDVQTVPGPGGGALVLLAAAGIAPPARRQRRRG